MGPEPSLTCGVWIDRKEDVGLPWEHAGACRCIVLAVVEVGMGSVRKCKGLQMRLLVLEGCVLFPVGLNESSLSCFRLLMRVPSGLLRVSWPSPGRKWCSSGSLSPRPILYSEHHKERTFRRRLPVVLKSSDCINQLLVSSGWIPTYLSWCDICLSLNAVGSVSSCGVKASGRILLFGSFSLPWTFPLSSPQSVSILVIWPLHSSKSWFGLFTLWRTVSQISKLFYSQSFNNIYSII